MTRYIGYWDNPTQAEQIELKVGENALYSKFIGFLFSRTNLGKIKMPCGHVFDIRKFEIRDTPCPCGNKDCWLIKVE